MKYYINEMASFHSNENLTGYVEKFIDLVRRNPLILEAIRGKSEDTDRIFGSAGYILYSTVKRTTLFITKKPIVFLKYSSL